MDIEKLLKLSEDCGNAFTELENKLKSKGIIPQDVYIVNVNRGRGAPVVYYVKESDVKSTGSLPVATFTEAASKKVRFTTH